LNSASFGGLLDAIRTGVVVLELEDPTDDMSLRLTYANSAASVLAGDDLAARIGWWAREALPRSTPERLRVYAECCRLRQPRTLGTVVAPGPPHVARAFHVEAVPVGDNGLAVCFERVAIEQVTSPDDSMGRFLASVLEHLPAMVFMKEARELRFEYFNRAGEELLGVGRETLLGKNDHDLFPKEQADFFVAKDRLVLASGVVEDIPEEPIETPRGRRWLHTRKIPILDATGQPQRLLGVSVDITEQKLYADALIEDVRSHRSEIEAQRGERLRAEEQLKSAEEQLRQSQKMEAIGRLAGGVSHDFNNLLSVIMSYTSLGIEKLSEDDPLRSELGEVMEASKRASDLTRQLLAFSRQQVLEPKIVDLNRVVGELERMLARLIGEHIEFRAVPGARHAKVRVDPTQIEQVIMNLVVNARDAMPDGGKLTIETANVELDESYAAEHAGVTPGPHVMLAVSDNGHGMDRQTQARAFEPFFTTKEVGRGTGMGLSTVFGIVRQSGGHVWVYSEPGRGATFKVYLPSVSGQEDAASVRAISRGHRGHETVLLVEDEDQVRRVLVAVLTRNGYDVLPAASGREAVRIAENDPRPIHLLLTDVVMPEMSGPDVVNRVRAFRPGLRAVCMSGYTDETVLRHGILESGMAFLQKPITPTMLLGKVREVLDSDGGHAAVAPKAPA
jgi:PAS domain S-box-containing protein